MRNSGNVVRRPISSQQQDRPASGEWVRVWHGKGGKMIKQLFIDTETTGVNTDIVGMYQVGGIIRVGKREEEFEFNCDIFEEDEIDPKAFEKNGLTLKEIATFPTPQDTFEKFINLLDKYIDRYDKKDKFIVIGYGAEFDQRILSNWFYKLGDDYFRSWFWHPWIDVMNLAMYVVKDYRSDISSFKLKSIAEHFHIRTDDTKLHTALYDAQITRKIYNKLEHYINS